MPTTTGCATHSHPGPTVTAHVWWYYPGWDIYYCRTTSLWWYWDGTVWVSVSTLPTWIVMPTSAYYVILDFEGPEPWGNWPAHSQTWAGPPEGRPAPATPRAEPSAPRRWQPESRAGHGPR
ncbi:MAG: hypothetical protein AB7K09_07420 [Planctomycetota bacterium]